MKNKKKHISSPDSIAKLLTEDISINDGYVHTPCLREAVEYGILTEDIDQLQLHKVTPIMEGFISRALTEYGAAGATAWLLDQGISDGVAESLIYEVDIRNFRSNIIRLVLEAEDSLAGSGTNDEEFYYRGIADFVKLHLRQVAAVSKKPVSWADAAKRLEERSPEAASALALLLNDPKSSVPAAYWKDIIDTRLKSLSEISKLYKEAYKSVAKTASPPQIKSGVRIFSPLIFNQAEQIAYLEAKTSVNTVANPLLLFLGDVKAQMDQLGMVDPRIANPEEWKPRISSVRDGDREIKYRVQRGHTLERPEHARYADKPRVELPLGWQRKKTPAPESNTYYVDQSGIIHMRPPAESVRASQSTHFGSRAIRATVYPDERHRERYRKESAIHQSSDAKAEITLENLIRLNTIFKELADYLKSIPTVLVDDPYKPIPPIGFYNALSKLTVSGSLSPLQIDVPSMEQDAIPNSDHRHIPERYLVFAHIGTLLTTWMRHKGGVEPVTAAESILAKDAFRWQPKYLESK